MNYTPGKLRVNGTPAIGFHAFMSAAGGREADAVSPVVPVTAVLPFAGRPMMAAAHPAQPVPADVTAAAAPARTEELNIDSILRMNIGKTAVLHLSIGNNTVKLFKGRIESAGRDHVIVRDAATGAHHLLKTASLDYISFEEEIKLSPLGFPGKLR